MTFKADDCKGGKWSKERVTIGLCCSITGEKLKPVFIGKAAKPGCFSVVDKGTLPVVVPFLVVFIIPTVSEKMNKY